MTAQEARRSPSGDDPDARKAMVEMCCCLLAAAVALAVFPSRYLQGDGEVVGSFHFSDGREVQFIALQASRCASNTGVRHKWVARRRSTAVVDFRKAEDRHLLRHDCTVSPPVATKTNMHNIFLFSLVVVALRMCRMLSTRTATSRCLF